MLNSRRLFFEVYGLEDARFQRVWLQLGVNEHPTADEGHFSNPHNPQGRMLFKMWGIPATSETFSFMGYTYHMKGLYIYISICLAVGLCVIVVAGTK